MGRSDYSRNFDLGQFSNEKTRQFGGLLSALFSWFLANKEQQQKRKKVCVWRCEDEIESLRISAPTDLKSAPRTTQAHHSREDVPTPILFNHWQPNLQNH
jgi:hypothetical protein